MESKDNPSKSEKSNEDEELKKDKPKKKDIATILHHLYIAHELAINEDLSVTVNKADDERCENMIRTSLSEFYWSIFEEEISENPPKLDMAFQLLTEIKKGLDLVMTPNVTKLRTQVAQVLDLEQLRKQAEDGTIDVMHYAKYIISVIGRICAPVRDKDVAKLAKENDIVAIFRGILEIITLMKRDLLSFSLAVIKPDIMANHLAYERDTFREYISATGEQLTLTSKWLEKHRDSNKTIKEITDCAFIDLLTWDSAEPYPETLFLEEERLKKLKIDYFRLTVSCSLVLLSLGLIPPALHAEENFKESIKNFITIMMSEAQNYNDVKDLAKNIAAELISKITNSLKNKEGSSEMQLEFKLFQETMEQVSLPENKIRVLVCTRVNDYLKASLTAQQSTETHFPPALNLFKTELNALKILFERICKHNVLVCMEHYERLLGCPSDEENLKQVH